MLAMTLGVVLQDVVADAMTTEVVARTDAAGAPRPQAEINAELAMVQVLGRLALLLGLFATSGLGGVLAAIHRLGIRREVAAAALLPLWDPAAWDEYALELQELRGLRPAMERLRDVVAAGRSLVGKPVLSHGDLNVKNLLRQPDGVLVLLDWDSAEPTDPAMDAAGAAAGLGGLQGRAPRPAVVRAFMRAYRGGGEFDKADYRVFAGMLNGLHGWLFALYRRAVSAPTAAERAQGRRLAGQLARRLPLILDSLDSWARLLD